MKKNLRINNHKLNSDEKFARKLIFRTLTAVFLFFLIYLNSLIPYELNKKLNNQIKHYLTSSIDFKDAANKTMEYAHGISGYLKALPASKNTPVSENQK